LRSSAIREIVERADDGLEPLRLHDDFPEADSLLPETLGDAHSRLDRDNFFVFAGVVKESAGLFQAWLESICCVKVSSRP